VVQAFAPMSAKLSTEQKLRLTRFAAKLNREFSVTCTGYAGDGPPRLMLSLAKQRARNVCRLISGVAPDVAIDVETASLGGLNVGSVGDIGATKRRVVVVAKSGEKASIARL